MESVNKKFSCMHSAMIAVAYSTFHSRIRPPDQALLIPIRSRRKNGRCGQASTKSIDGRGINSRHCDSMHRARGGRVKGEG